MVRRRLRGGVGGWSERKGRDTGAGAGACLLGCSDRSSRVKRKLLRLWARWSRPVSIAAIVSHGVYCVSLC